MKQTSTLDHYFNSKRKNNFNERNSKPNRNNRINNHKNRLKNDETDILKDTATSMDSKEIEDVNTTVQSQYFKNKKYNSNYHNQVIEEDLDQISDLFFSGSPHSYHSFHTEQKNQFNQIVHHEQNLTNQKKDGIQKNLKSDFHSNDDLSQGLSYELLEIAENIMNQSSTSNNSNNSNNQNINSNIQNTNKNIQNNNIEANSILNRSIDQENILNLTSYHKIAISFINEILNQTNELNENMLKLKTKYDWRQMGDKIIIKLLTES